MKLPRIPAYLKGVAAVTALSVTLTIFLFRIDVPILQLFELKLYDLRFLQRGYRQPSPAIALAMIDEKSLDQEGRWPWPRSTIAALVNRLSDDGAKVIGFDIGFLEPEEHANPTVPQGFSEALARLNAAEERPDGRTPQRLQKDINDRILADSIRQARSATVLGYFFHMSPSELNYDIEKTEIDRQLALIGKSKYPMILQDDPDASRLPFITAYAPEANLKLFSDAADAAGFFTVASDRDGVVRNVPLMIKCGEDLFPHLAVMCALHYLDRPQTIVKVPRYGVEGVQMGQRFIPTDENGLLRINYLGPAGTFPHYSITDILKGKTPAGTFTNRIVLVGASAVGTHDLRSTPFSSVYPGVEIHATIIDNILTGHYISKPRWSEIFDLIAIITIGLLPGIFLPRVKATLGLLIALGVFSLHVLFTRWLFVQFDLWLNMVYPLTSLVVSYTFVTVFLYATVERDRKRIKSTFRQYVAPLVIEEMLKDPEQLTLGGEEKVLTVLFCDLERFTSYTEIYGPSEMVKILSDYFTRMSEEIFKQRGTLKEYVGDEIMAFFGAPIEQPNHAQRACEAALAMRDGLRRLCEGWIDIDRPFMHARTGINSGPMLLGNLGSRYRFAYGVLGDQVNLGSRLEGLNKMYGTEILIGENTYAMVKDDFILRDLDLVRVVGREQCVRVYELVGRSDAVLSPEHLGALEAYAAGYDEYCRQHWPQAIAYLERALSLRPDDGPSKTMLARCRVYQDDPPADDWECVFEPKTK
ncbi:adenylate/guanylate cyclase domain-containing protein [Desulfosarcina sp.]|uniref:CHASE2 domain-containing protein n=1 Tax=Desulfosarcina sp. TaxID=2027861 RepID=UPI0029A8E57B|nr:adenylate/guanylate cyclase domain-containing protein [Desulfosarcina sp.]MDX2451709.1 adenylate/guanylate cyclase domain-containing protein [Desulfosarcina sp.]MDX2489496.1 adenylate/guanylate cyclase domain-containing protein [Desulfosarcina sp.]